MKFSVAAIIIFLLFANCSKSKDSSTNSASYLKGKIDGVAFECNSHIHATRPQPPGDSHLVFSGDWSTGSIELINSNSSGSITPGEYIFVASEYRRGTIWINGFPYGAGDDPSSGTLHGSGKITILEISSEYVKGNFEFTTYANPVKTVTNGEFYIKRS
jgi:hypothetical protein